MPGASDHSSRPSSSPLPAQFAPGNEEGAAPSSGTRTVPSGAASIALDTSGEGHALVLLHAGVADRRMWDAQIGAFSAAFRVVRYDLRGFGESTLPDEPFAPHDDLLAVLDALEIPRAHIVGVSMGGSVALDFALLHPERVSALILCGASPSGATAAPEIREGWAEVDALLEAGDIDAAIELELRMWVDGPVRTPDQVDPAVRQRVHEMEVLAFARALAEPEPETAPLDPPAVDRFRDVAVPTLVLCGDLDYPRKGEIARELAAGIGGARLEILAGTAHVPNMEVPDAFNRAVLGFLGDISARPGDQS